MTESMPPPHPTRIFLSYARGDDEAFVRRLHDNLVAAGFNVWFDRESLLSRGLVFQLDLPSPHFIKPDASVHVQDISGIDRFPLLGAAFPSHKTY